MEAGMNRNNIIKGAFDFLRMAEKLGCLGSADIIGEVLRATVFDYAATKRTPHIEPFGCYNYFDLVKGFKEAGQIPEIKRLVLGDAYEEVYGKDVSIECHYADFGDIHVTVAWHWDGDGSLAIILEGPTGGGYALLNNDCKCAYGWEVFKVTDGRVIYDEFSW